MKQFEMLYRVAELLRMAHQTADAALGARLVREATDLAERAQATSS